MSTNKNLDNFKEFEKEIQTNFIFPEYIPKEYLLDGFDASENNPYRKEQMKEMQYANDYPLWLLVSKKADCHLLPECLASQMSEKGLWNRLKKSEKWMWRYETYRRIEQMTPISATYMAFRNLTYTAYKWWKYGEKVK